MWYQTRTFFWPPYVADFEEKKGSFLSYCIARDARSNHEVKTETPNFCLLPSCSLNGLLLKTIDIYLNMDLKSFANKKGRFDLYHKNWLDIISVDVLASQVA